MGICLSAMMLLMGAGMTKDVKNCGKIRILGFYLQDVTGSFGSCLGAGLGFETEVSKFMDSVVADYPDSMFGIYSFMDGGYHEGPQFPPVAQKDDYLKITSLVDVPKAKTLISTVVLGAGSGSNSNAFEVMYHLIVNDSDSGLDHITPLPDTYDAKVFYVFTDGVPEYLESTVDECALGTFGGYPCTPWCNPMKANRCCEVHANTTHVNRTGVAYGKIWDPLASCPIDLETLGKKINENDWYVAYISASKVLQHGDAVHHPWTPQVARMGTTSRMAYGYTTYTYEDLAGALADITTNIMCSAVPSNNPSALPTGGASNPPTSGGPTTTGPAPGPTTGPTAGGSTTEGSTTAPTTPGPTQSGQGGTTTTTKKPFPIGLVCGCAAGALAAIAGGVVAANRLSGYPPMPEFEFEGEEGMGREVAQRETQVAMGEADFA